MTLWNVKRVWKVDTAGGETLNLPTLGLARFRCAILLGAAGAGKTTEARRLANHERASGRAVRECRLAEYADTSPALEGHLQKLAAGADAATSFHLDALDEAMMLKRGRWLAIKHWIEQNFQETGASIRVTCRTAVWPKELSDAILRLCGQQSFAMAYLQPLSEEDVAVAAESHGIGPAPFLAQIEKARGQSLARHPLTLEMLLDSSRDGDSLPSTLKDLFARGVRMLACDSQARRAIGTHAPLSSDRLLEAAERMACYTILTGRETVNLEDVVSSSQLGLQDLSGRVGDNAEIDEDDVRAVGSSGLCDSAAPATFRFAYRQFAEYLAGRRLARLPTHQARTFLAGPDGWRSGAAGPLRETAAFAAMLNADLAEWLSSRDPEVIGLSDVADDDLRRQAMLGLLNRFRSGAMTGGELRRSEIELRGFRYEGAETDLRPVLEERGNRCEDVLEYAIFLIRSWRLSSMSDALADLALDLTAPLDSRTSAGHALRECETDVARERLKPLVAGRPEDDSDELKGIALQCNWPDRLSTPELFDALTPRRRQSFFGAYAGFLYGLDADGFPPAGHVAAGLRWAGNLTSEQSDTDPLHRLGMRIAHAALRELDDPEIAAELVSLMRGWIRNWKSPLASLRGDPLEPPSNDDAPLYVDRQVRRKLIDRLAEFVESTEELRNLAFKTPGLPHEEDFQWILRRSLDNKQKLEIREKYLEIAAYLPWRGRPKDVDAWLHVCDIDPVKKILGNQKSIDLDSEEASRLREQWKIIHGDGRKAETPKLDPPPRDRVLRALVRSETEDVRYFPDLCLQLTLKPMSTHYEFGRFLTNTPGWRDADARIRSRIVEAAKCYLSVETVAKEFASNLSPNSIHPDGLAAMWLVLDRDPGWLKSRPENWWGEWCRYVLAESSLNRAGEPADPKRKLAALLNDAAASSVCREVLRMLSSNEDGGHHGQLSDALYLLADLANPDLDEALCEALETGAVRDRDVVSVVEFVLTRARDLSFPKCLRILKNAARHTEKSPADQVAVALLRKCPDASWTALKTFLDFDGDRARRVLEAFACGNLHEPFDMSTRQSGELLGMLLDLFPPESDSDEDEGSLIEPVDAVHLFRVSLISHLDNLRNEESFDVFRRLEQQLGDRYPWLANARIHASRGYHLSRWTPFPVDGIASVMNAETRRLLRSDEDVIDGIECALEQYASTLRQDGMESAEDLWNTAAGAAPSPKSEEHVSRKLCGVVRSYFRDYAVTADREVEVYRRSVSRADGGLPGSKVDVLVQVPGPGTVSGDKIRVPMEVKLSSNDEAKTGMQDQLVDRYMSQLGATHGVHVVVWMTTPNPGRLQRHHRPKWDCIETARRELDEEARRLSEERKVRVRAVVLDGSLR